MIPQFKHWVENQEEEENNPLSEPQHEKGEGALTLNQVIEKRILEIIEEYERKGKASKDDVINSIKYFLDKNKPTQPPQSSQNQNSPENPQTQPDQANQANQANQKTPPAEQNQQMQNSV